MTPKDLGLVISVGRIVRSHGVRGEAKFLAYFPEAMQTLVGRALTLSPNGGAEPFESRLISYRSAPKSIVRFDGIDTPEAVRNISPCGVSAPQEFMPRLPDGEYYYEQIVGLPVENVDGEPLGILSDFFPAGEKDVWAIRTPDGGELLVPCTPATLKKVDLEKGVIVMEPMETME